MDKNDDNGMPARPAHQTLYCQQKSWIICPCLIKANKDWNIAVGQASYHFPDFNFASALNNETSTAVACSLYRPMFTLCMDGVSEGLQGLQIESASSGTSLLKSSAILSSPLVHLFFLLSHFGFETHFQSNHSNIGTGRCQKEKEITSPL